MGLHGRERTADPRRVTATSVSPPKVGCGRGFQEARHTHLEPQGELLGEEGLR